MTTSKKKHKKEEDFINNVFSTYNDDISPIEKAMRELIFKTFKPYFQGKRGLELGCSNGYLTKMLASAFDEFDVVDGSAKALEVARKKNIKASFTKSLFEEYKVPAEKRYDCIFAIYVFEHVLDPKQLLRSIKKMLKPGGYLFVVVPNSRALSRQLALRMDILNRLDELTPNDLNHGHRRVFNRSTLDNLVLKSGYSIIAEGGILLKILADFQLDDLINKKIIDSKVIDGLYKLGLEYPDFAGSLFTICKTEKRS